MTELPTNLVKCNPTFAASKKAPAFFVAKTLIETPKAVYLYGRGTVATRNMGICMVCGRALTHPVSISLGIGPECGSHFHDWDLIGGYSETNKKTITQAILDIVVDGWFPKSVVTFLDTDETVLIPPDHPKMNEAKPEKKAQIKKATMITFQNTDLPGIKIEFPFDPDTLNKVKLIPGRRFHNEGYNSKYWTAPLSEDAVDCLAFMEFEIDPQIEKFLQKSRININDMDEIDIPGLMRPLFPYQKKGVAFVEAKNGRALIADSMGLGKTAQALAWLQLHPEKHPVIIVVPASLKLNWERECSMWMSNPNVQILSGKKPNTPIHGNIIIINYDILSAWLKVLKGVKPKVLILDECHKAKNKGAKRTKAVISLSKVCPHIIALSGTPIENRPAEIYNAVHMIDPAVAGPWMSFGKKYCNGHHNGFGWDFNGASNVAELHDKLTNSIMIRRKKEDVLPDLPPKIRSFVPAEINNRKKYARVEGNFIGWVKAEKGLAAAEKASNAETLAKISALKQLAAEGKIKAATEWIKDHLDGNGKLVVFAVHKKIMDILMQSLEEYNPVKVDGSVSQQGRQNAVDTFQNDESCRVFIGNIQAAGVGLTLTASSSVAFIELPWAPGEVSQAEDRCHRIGQKNSVNIYYLLAEGTIEETMARLIDEKRKVLDQVLDGIETENTNLLSELISEYAN